MQVPALTFRIAKGSSLTYLEGDNNFRVLQDFSNGLAKLVSNIVNDDGTFKTSIIGAAQLIPGSITSAALADQSILPQTIANIIAGPGLVKAVPTDPISVLTDNVTIGINSAVTSSGQLLMLVNPTAGDTFVMTINGTAVTFTFVATIGVSAGNVLIASSVQGTASNLLGILQSPATTNSSQVALSGPNQTLVGYFTYSISGSTITITAGNSVSSLLTSVSTSGNQFVASSNGKLRVLGGAACPVASTRNFIALNNVSTPNTKVDVTFDECVVKDGSGIPLLVSSPGGFTVDTAVIGAINGLDALPAQASSTWYYLYVIYNPTSLTVAGLLSLSATAPTLPAGYTHKALVSTVRSDVSNHFVGFWQSEREIWTGELTILSGTTGVTSAWTALSGSPLTAFQGAIPPIGKIAWGNMGSSATSVNRAMAVAVNSNGDSASVIAAGTSSGTVDGFALGGTWRLPMKTSQLLYFRMSTTNSDYGLSVTGYRI